MSLLHGFKLEKLLERDANNLDLVRLFAAFLVIFSHTFVVIDAPWELVLSLDPSCQLKYDGVYAGAIAVKVFFFISGLLVTNSILKRKSAAEFIISRTLRIGPALLFLLFITAFLLGPIFSNLDFVDYFSQPATYHYFWENALLMNNTYLPGMFIDSPHPNTINISLWTLPYEAAAYGVVLLLFLTRIIYSRAACLVILGLLMAEPLLPKPFLFPFMAGNPHYTYIPSAFALGSFLALLKDRLTLSPLLVISTIIVFLAMKNTVLGPHLFYLALFFSLLYFSGLSWVRKLRLGADPSYGTYLWGFVVQQIIARNFAEKGFAFNLLTAAGVSLLFGLASWHLVEKHAITLGHYCGRRLQKRTSG